MRLLLLFVALLLLSALPAEAGKRKRTRSFDVSETEPGRHLGDYESKYALVLIEEYEGSLKVREAFLAEPETGEKERKLRLIGEVIQARKESLEREISRLAGLVSGDGWKSEPARLKAAEALRRAGEALRRNDAEAHTAQRRNK